MRRRALVTGGLALGILGGIGGCAMRQDRTSGALAAAPPNPAPRAFDLAPWPVRPSQLCGARWT